MEANTTEEMAQCPVCQGSKVSLVTGLACTRCNATGQIPQKLAQVLAGIRKDLGAKLLGDTMITRFSWKIRNLRTQETTIYNALRGQPVTADHALSSPSVRRWLNGDSAQATPV
jgi:hypothetical protein